MALFLRRLRRRHERGPRFSRFRLILNSLAGNGWNPDEMITSRTLNLTTRKLGVALQMLVTLGAGEFELIHRSFLIAFLLITSEPYEKWVRLATSCVIALFQQ